MSIKVDVHQSKRRLEAVGPGRGRVRPDDLQPDSPVAAEAPIPGRWVAPSGMSAPDLAAASARGASDALLDLATRVDDGNHLDDPLAAAAVRHARRMGMSIDPGDLLKTWNWRARNDVRGRFPWAGETGERFGADPAVTIEAVELLLELSADPDTGQSETASAILEELRPSIEDQLAASILALDPRGDTLPLWLVAHHPRSLEEFHALTVAIAMRYAVLARRTAGLVAAARFAVLGKAPVSANAQLGTGLWSLGVYPTLMKRILRSTARRRADDGSWSDRDSPELVTTLVAADLLLGLDPTFDPGPTIGWLASVRMADGWWRPEDEAIAWPTAAIVDWLERARLPFVDRFAWPAVPKPNRDRKTQLPRYEYLDDLARALQALPALGAAVLDVGFGDLAHFGSFNSLHGQDAGDDVLGFFAATLQAALPRTRVVRDGGDEFIIVGPPTWAGLAEELEAFCRSWPATFVARFGPTVEVVSPRFTMTQVTGDALMAARERLGVRIGELKSIEPPPGGFVDRI
jgi:GGDEF domain-containing protein